MRIITFKNVMEHYGIATEKELLSGMIIHVKNRLSDNDEVDGTLFTTNRVHTFLTFHMMFFIKIYFLR